MRPKAGGYDIGRLFPETGKRVRGPFLAYYDAHDGRTRYGLPITSQFQQRTSPSGDVYWAQYFQSALFEMSLSGTNSADQIVVKEYSKEQYAESLNRETWPAYSPDPSWATLAQQAQADLARDHTTYVPADSPYSSSSQFLNFAGRAWTNGPKLQIGSDGIPLAVYDDKAYPNPVTVCQYALSMYSKYLRGDAGSSREDFIKGVDRLLTLQDTEGAFHFPFKWYYYLTRETFQEGWVSGLAQGQALSVLYRAFHLTGDRRYLDAGDKALDFLLQPISQGGVRTDMSDLHPSLSKFVFFEEYVASPSPYTVNGFMFILLGLHDWSKIPSAHASIAGEYFRQGVATLKHILPYYDIGGMVSYEMSHVIYAQPPTIFYDYHPTHLMLIHALHSVTGDGYLKKIEEQWVSYIPAYQQDR